MYTGHNILPRGYVSQYFFSPRYLCPQTTFRSLTFKSFFRNNLYSLPLIYPSWRNRQMRLFSQFNLFKGVMVEKRKKMAQRKWQVIITAQLERRRIQRGERGAGR